MYNGPSDIIGNTRDTIGDSMLSSVSLLIPAYNDEATIGRVVKEARAVGKLVAKRYEVIVVDDGSRHRIKPRHIKLITHATNQGYGRTIKELYYAGTFEWLFTIPGDYQVGAKELLKLIPYTGQGDMILGWRKDRHDPAHRRFASWVYNSLLRLIFGTALHDVNSVRLVRRSILTDVSLRSSSAFVDAELVIGAMRKGFRVLEVPISHRCRAGGGRGGGIRWRTVAETIIDMVRFFL